MKDHKIGRYRLVRELASGGMGSVWIATDEQLHRSVALKFMLPEHASSPTFRQQFETEARAIAKLQHPNVVEIYDYGFTDDNAPYIVMELLEGEDLRSRLKHDNVMPLATLMPLILQAVKALEAAHRAGIVHRDLKPANLFLVRQHGETTVKVLDFGVADTALRSHGNAGYNDGVWGGTPAYMSPEQTIIGCQVDHRSDLWSLAVVAYRAITGMKPFDGTTLDDTLARVVRSRHVPPSTLVPELPMEVDDFFQRALDKLPEYRFQSAVEFATHWAALDPRNRSERATKILVVDDEPGQQLLFRQEFRREVRKKTYQFAFAENGLEGLERLREQPDIAVILTDIRMPRMDGLDFLAQVSAHHPGVKVVIVSAFNDVGNIRTAMNRGAFDFLVKPFEPDDLRQTLRKALQAATEARSAVRAEQENQALRMFVDPTLLGQVLPIMRSSGQMGVQTIDVTLAQIVVEVPELDDTGVPPEEPLRLVNEHFDAIIPRLLSRGAELLRFHNNTAFVMWRNEEDAGPFLELCLDICRDHDARRSDHPASRADDRILITLDRGQVIRGAIGTVSGKRLEYTLLGPPVANVQRLAMCGERAGVLVTERVRKWNQGLFEYQLAGSVAGSGGDLEVSRLVGTLALEHLEHTEPRVR